MKFAELYPYKKGKNFPEKAYLFFSRNLRDHEFFIGKNKIDELFARLKDIDEGRELLASQQEDLIWVCDRIRKRFGEKSPMVDLATTAVKMEIFSRLKQSEKIQSEYSTLITSSNLNVSERQEKYVDYRSVSRSKFLCRTLFWGIPPALRIKAGTAPETISVPDALAEASIVCGKNHSHLRIREIFHELWQVENLKPLLTVAACATLGKRCNYKGQVSYAELPLQIIFSDKFIRSPGVSGTTTDNNTIIICLGDNTENKKAVYYSNASLRGAIARELHHFWEQFTHNSGSALPYPEDRTPQRSKNRIESDSNLERKDQLSKMLEEAENVTEEFHIKILKRIDDDTSREEDREPFQTFKNLASCSKDLRTRHTEIVVRVSDAFASMVGEGGVNEAEALRLMRFSGLNQCVNFFYQEQKCMELAIRKMGQRFREVSTSDESHEIPPYAVYSCTPFHQAVREGNLEALQKLIAEEICDPTKKDSSNETALELALRSKRPELIFAFAKSTKILLMLEKDLNLLRRTIFYLFDHAKDETSEHHQEALELFRNANKMTGGSGVSRIFSDMMVKTLDAYRAALLEGKVAMSTVGERRLDGDPSSAVSADGAVARRLRGSPNTVREEGRR